MSDITQLVRDLRRLEADHEPEGYPAVTMGQITAILDEIEAIWEDRGPGRTCPQCGSWVPDGWIHGCG